MARTSAASVMLRALSANFSTVTPGKKHQRRRLDGKEGVAQVLQQVVAEAARILAGRDTSRHRLQRPGRVVFGQGVDQLGQGAGVVFSAARRRQLFQGGLRVPSRTPSPPHGQPDRIGGQPQAGGLVDVAEELG